MDSVSYEERNLTFELVDHPGVVYTATVVRSPGSGWAIAEFGVTARAGRGLEARDRNIADQRLVEIVVTGIDPYRATSNPVNQIPGLEGLPTRALNQLHNYGYRTAEQVFSASDAELREVSGVGERAVRLIREREAHRRDYGALTHPRGKRGAS